MMFKEIDFSPGKIVYDDFDIESGLPLEQQIFSLKEDMFQVNYDDKYIIDIGWGLEFDLKGFFKVKVVKDFDWTHPIYLKKTNDIQTLFKLVKECVEVIKIELNK